MTYRLEEGSLIELTSTIASKEVSLPQTLNIYRFHLPISQANLSGGRASFF